jgi:hypothetical protein
VLPRQTLDSYLFVFPLFGWPFLMFDSISFRVDCWKIKSHSTKRGVYTAHSYFVELTKYKNGAPPSEKHQRLPHTPTANNASQKNIISDRRHSRVKITGQCVARQRRFAASSMGCSIHNSRDSLDQCLHSAQPRDLKSFFFGCWCVWAVRSDLLNPSRVRLLASRCCVA